MFESLKEKLLTHIQKKFFGSTMYRKRQALDLVKYKRKTGASDVSPVTKFLSNASQVSAEALVKKYHSNVELGLSPNQVESFKDKYGLNEIRFNKPTPWYFHLWQCYANPFNLLLSALAAFEYFTNDVVGSSIVATMVVIATVLRFFQERRSKIAMNRLKTLVCNTATVIRSTAVRHPNTGEEHFIPTRQEVVITDLVPGDIMHYSAGDMVPADVRVLSAKDLFVSQSVLTGESMPVEKFATPKNKNANVNLLDLDNILFSGSNVVSGTAKALVISTANKTYFGDLATRIVKDNRITPTQFQKGVNLVSMMLIKLMLFMVPVVFLVNGFTKGNWLEATLFALSVAVGLTPEMLPMIVTSTLAKGATFMAKKKVIVKKLEALQNFGAMDVLCTDKTGTLTQDKIALELHTDIYGEACEEVLCYAHINSYYQTGLKNLLDVAVLEHVELKAKDQALKKYHKVDELPFDFTRRRMSVIVKQENSSNDVLICKGALEEILNICTHVVVKNKKSKIEAEVMQNILKTTEKLNEQGLRVVAVAIKEFPHKDVYTLEDEQGLTLMGYIAFLDPPKESTKAALEGLAKIGVSVKVLTGDNFLVTKKVCKDVGLSTANYLTGDDIERMGDEEIYEVIDKTNLFVKLTPDHKERIVNILKSKDHTVGFLGDGINDSPALRAADVGISVDTAVGITRESADLILLEKSLTILEEGVKEGRKTFANMLKYIRMTVSSNFGNVFSVLIASIFIPFLPILPMQILIQNLLYDLSQTVIPFDNVEPEILNRPQKWDSSKLGSFTMFFGPISSIFDVITFIVLWYVFKANTTAPADVAFFQTGWYLEGFLSQIMIVHAIRTSKIPFFQSIASLPVITMSLVMIFIGMVLPFTMIGHSLGFVSLPYGYLGWVVLIVICYVTLTQLVKRFYINRYGWN